MIILKNKKTIIDEESPLLWSSQKHSDNFKIFIDKYQKQQKHIGDNLESVCGEDSRTPINHVSRDSSNQYRATCHLAITFKDGLKAATGFFISPRKVVTAAHCLYDKDKNWGYADKIIIRPGLHINSDGNVVAPFLGDFSEAVIVPQEWIDTGKNEYDYGLIILASDELYNKAGNPNFKLWAADDNSCNEISVECWGYPDLSPFPNQQLYKNEKEKISDITERILYSYIDVSPGNSGGALVHEGEMAVGICSHQYNGCISPNGFTRIRDDIKKNIEEYPTT